MMKHQKSIHKSIYLVMLVLGMLAGCQGQTLPTQTEPSPTPISSATSSPTSLPSLTLTQAPPSPTPATHYQLTFVSECQEESMCMYAIDMGCLESEQPCIGEPQLLFEISKQGQGPRPPISPYDWSPDGQQVVIEAPGLRGKGDVFVGDWAGQNWINLTNTPNYEGSPAWSPDGLYIAYTANSGDPDHIVWAFSTRPDGTGVSQLLSILDFSGVRHPSWSPDGKQLAFVHSDENGYSQIFTANLDGSDLKQLTTGPEDHGLSGFSPDGQWILYTLETEKGSAISNIFLVRPDGSGEIAVTQETRGYRSRPVWSPEGDWIAFAAKIEGNYDIYLIRADGTKLIRVTLGTANEVAPAWRMISP
jgi:WD40 repeat protein